VHLFLLGVSHRTAPIELRERLDFATRGVGDALRQLASRPEGCEAAVLSTCNRAEVYLAAENVDGADRQVRAFFSEYHQVPQAELDPHFYDAVDDGVARHLFRVASGLDSLVVGEPQILGQVKDAFSTARHLQTTGPLLNRLFHTSFSVGKRVRTETALAEGAVSVSFAAVELARKIFGDLTGRAVIVIGAGEMGKLTALHLRSQGAGPITIVSRTSGHASDLAERLSAGSVPWDQLPVALATADIVVTATGSDRPILGRNAVQTAMPSRRHRPLFIIDIALPRDIEPSVGEIEQVFLYNLDDLQSIVRDNLSRRGSEVARAEALVDEEVVRFTAWLQSREAIPTVVALRHHFESVRQSELRRLEPKLSNLAPSERGKVEEVTRLIVEKLLLLPTEQLKSIADPQKVVIYADAVNRLFGLTPADGGDTRRAPEPQAADSVEQADSPSTSSDGPRNRVRV
jgi:glutamyl-tRNA reductase